MATNPNVNQLAAASAAVLSSIAPVGYLAVVEAHEGRWVATGSSGPRRALPDDLLAEVLDRDMPLSADGWLAAPLDAGAPGGEALVVSTAAAGAESASLADALAALAPVVATALRSARAEDRELARVRRLETILELAARWNQSQQLQPLLEQMAEAATRLLEADRASIFLWDRSNGVLVGRPALGVEGGELRVADDRGVVAEVVRSGESRRVSTTSEPGAVDRSVDKQTGYQTDSLLCVPLKLGGGRIIGAFEVLNKRSGSFSPDDESALLELATHAAAALENTRDREGLLAANRQMTEQAAAETQLVGESASVDALRSIVGRVAGTELAVLILGENGTGKEVVARSIHFGSSRRSQPFVAVNCAAIPDTLAESELFGHEKGAFTDAHEARAGKFELAAEGTLFLDEIGELTLACQAKLLRVLEEKVLVRVGGSRPIRTEARVLAATNQNLVEMVREKRFREDLYFRLNVVTIDLPPLRERGDDVLLLARHFLEDFSAKANRPTPEFTSAARRRLLEHPWPGNVRELRNLMERLAYLATSDRIDADELAFILAPQSQREGADPIPADLPLADATAEFQMRYIRQVVNEVEGNVSQAADRLGLHRSNLYRKMRQLGMEEEG
jgi:transcriptional regulator with GAF, ATPase, and Fis domain